MGRVDGAVGGIGVVTIVLGFVGAIPGILVLWFLLKSVGLVEFFALNASVLFTLLVGQTLTGIAKTALSLYTTEDETPPYFEDIDFDTDSESGTRGVPGTLHGPGGTI